MRTATRWIAPVAILFFGAGCATADSLWTGTFGGADDRTTKVEVENTNYADMRIYAIRDGARHSLGWVPSMTTQSFRLPSQWLDTLSDIHLLADASVSSDEYRSEPFRVTGGQVVELRISDPASFSTVSIWDR